VNKIPGGYILKARKALESDLMDKPPLWSKLWDWMLLRAEWRTDGKLERGQFRTSIEDMREAMSWHVGYRKVTPSIKEMRKAYEGLAKGNMVGIARGIRGMLITVLNYDLYQEPKNYEGHDEGQHERSTKGTQRAHVSKEVKEVKKKNLKDSCADPSEAEGCAPPATTPDPVAFELPLNITGEVFPITEYKIAQLAPLYPAVNVREQIGLALGWLIGNPDKRKTRGGCMKFVTNWLAKEQNRGGAQMGLVLGQPRATTVHQQKQVEGGQKARLLLEYRRRENEQGANADLADSGGPALPAGLGSGGTGGNGEPVGGLPERVRAY